MSEYILLQSSDGEWRRVAKTDMPDEASLQALVKENPQILPLDSLGDSFSPLMTIGRETVLLNGKVDLVGIDQNGLITLVECKLDRNPEIKRKVIGQILGYAAFLWEMTYEQLEIEIVRKYFDSNECHRKDWLGVPLSVAMEQFRNEKAIGGSGILTSLDLMQQRI